MDQAQSTPRGIAPTPPREDKIFLAIQWHILNRENLLPLHGLAATYTDACRKDSHNGSEYTGIDARIRNSWRLAQKSLGSLVAAPTEGNSV